MKTNHPPCKDLVMVEPARALSRPLWHGLASTALLIVGMIVGGASAQSELLSRQNVEAFRQAHACPLTGMTHDPCPGWTVALITPRCAAGLDDPANMQWLTSAAAAAKEEAEAKQCPAATAPRR